MLNFEKLLLEKYGESFEKQGAKCYLRIGRQSNNNYSSYLYASLSEKKLNQNINEFLPEAHPNLVEFWRKYNGVDLCMRSIGILGFEAEDLETLSANNIGMANLTFQVDFYQLGLKNNDLEVCGAYIAGKILCYRKSELGKFYLLDSGNKMKPMQVFDTIDEFLSLYVERELSVRDEAGFRLSEYGNDLVLRPKDIEFQKQFPSIEALVRK